MTQEEIKTALTAEFETDSLHKGYAALIASGNDAGLLAEINKLDRPGTAAVGEVKRQAILRGYWGKVKSAQESENLMVKMASIAAYDWLSDTRITDIDFSFPEVQQMIGILNQAGLLTAEDVTEIQKLGANRKSRAEELLGRQATLSDISFTLRGTS